MLDQFLKQIPTNGNDQEVAESDDDEENDEAIIIRQIKDFKLGHSLYKIVDPRLFVSGSTKRYICSLISSVASPNSFNRATLITQSFASEITAPSTFILYVCPTRCTLARSTSRLVIRLARSAENSATP